MTTEEIDYNYFNTPELIQKVIEENGGIATFLTFCQLHHVEIYRGGDYMYGLLVDKQTGTWSTDLDGFSALIFGIANYLRHHANTHQTTNSPCPS